MHSMARACQTNSPTLLESRRTSADGFTIKNGGKYTGGAGLNKYGTGGIGGGFYIGVASPLIVNNRITRNGLAYDNRPVFP